jgi:DNA-binding transcriptional regulator YiaG
MKTRVADRVLRRLQDFTEALESGEKIADRYTCRRIELDLKPTPYTPAMVKAVRDLLGVSQGVFAKFLGVAIKTVCSWEQGVNTPSDMACRFLDEIKANPKYWRKRLNESVRLKASKAAT